MVRFARRRRQKFSKSAAGYRDKDSLGFGLFRDCGDCVMSSFPLDPDLSGTCTLVEGPISRDSVCRFWVAL